MKTLTSRQQEVRDFIQATQAEQGVSPTLREIARHFGFRSMKAAVDHVRALRGKGVVVWQPRRARSLRLVALGRRRTTVEVPVYGAIPAGFPDGRQQENQECLAVDMAGLGLRPTARTFALQVRGDSMIGKHILPGDYVILEHGKTVRPGDVVAALIDNESTLKTFLLDKGKPCLRAENPRYPQLIPARELVIQGVMVALVRKCQ